jgi:hypothetical protein
MRRFCGQSLSESTLIMVLVALTSLGGLKSLAPQLFDTLEAQMIQLGLMKGKQATPVSVTSTVNQPPGLPSPTVVSSSSSLSVTTSHSSNGPVVANATQASITLSNGKVIQIDNFAATPGELVEVSGINGITTNYALSISQIAKALEAAGELDSNQSNALIELANKGYALANAHKALEDISAQYANVRPEPTRDQVMAMTVTVNGKQMTFEEATKTIVDTTGGYSSNGNVQQFEQYIKNFQQQNTTPNGLYKEFITAYQTALDKGALSQSSVKSLVGSLSVSISGSSDLLGDSASGGSPVSAIQSTSTSEENKAKSSTICSTGGGSSSGTTCQ